MLNHNLETVLTIFLPSAMTLHSHGSALEKDTAKGIQRQPSTRDKLKEHVRKLSIKLVGPSCHE